MNKQFEAAEELSPADVMEKIIETVDKTPVDVVTEEEIDLAREQAKMNNYVQMLPRKMRRKILNKISFSNRFKRANGLNSK